MLKSCKVTGQYKNGNYFVYFFDNGTKIRFSKEDEFKPEFPESIDLCITKRCSMGCQQCYENALPNGKHWKYDDFKEILKTIHPYTELAINGNDWENIPGLDSFLIDAHKQNIIVNATFHFEQYIRLYSKLKPYQEEGMLHGIGVSINQTYSPAQLKCLRYCDNVVIHTINGLFNEELYNQLNSLDFPVKLLILGYKDKGRGILYKHLYPKDVADNMQWLNDNIQNVMKSENFTVVSFDNLALKQLDMKHKMDEQDYSRYYMGDDGDFTMYIDAVEMKYAISSTREQQVMIPTISIPSISELFSHVQKLKMEEQAKDDIADLDI